MKGPDFEIPPDPPASPETAVPAPVRRPRRGAAAVAVLAALTAAAGAAAYWTTAPGSSPAGLPSTVPLRSTSTSVVTTTTSTTTPLVRSNARTCDESQGETTPLEIRPAGVPGAPITLRYSHRVSSEALTVITDSLALARSVFGDTGAMDVVVHCDVEQYVGDFGGPPDDARRSLSEGLVAQVARGDVWIYGPNFDRPSVTQRRVVYHEYFHIVQRFLGRSRTPQQAPNPLWLMEGSARYFEYSVVPQDIDTFRNTEVRRWSRLPALAELESTGGGIPTGGSGQAYTLGSVASDYLVNTYGREKLQHDLWTAMGRTDWRTAFQEVFGVTVDDFYAQFEAYRLTLRP